MFCGGLFSLYFVCIIVLCVCMKVLMFKTYTSIISVEYIMRFRNSDVTYYQGVIHPLPLLSHYSKTAIYPVVYCATVTVFWGQIKLLVLVLVKLYIRLTQIAESDFIS